MFQVYEMVLWDILFINHVGISQSGHLRTLGTYFTKPGLSETLPVCVCVSASVCCSQHTSLAGLQGVVATSFVGLQSVASFDHLKILLCFGSLATKSPNRCTCITECLCGESNICLLKREFENQSMTLKSTLPYHR